MKTLPKLFGTKKRDDGKEYIVSLLAEEHPFNETLKDWIRDEVHEGRFPNDDDYKLAKEAYDLALESFEDLDYMPDHEDIEYGYFAEKFNEKLNYNASNIIVYTAEALSWFSSCNGPEHVEDFRKEYGQIENVTQEIEAAYIMRLQYLAQSFPIRDLLEAFNLIDPV